MEDRSLPEQVVLIEDFERTAPEYLFTCFVDPSLLVQWWPQTADVDPRLGGSYHLSWPSMNWHLRGDYTEFSPGEALGFTWKWDHDGDKPPRTVRITFEPHQAGTRLTIVHGTYTESEDDQEERSGHIEGWKHFLTKLDAVPAVSGG